MRVTMRFLANVKPERFLEAGNPTGLTGLLTHATPRPTLLHLYQATLERLKTFPEHSVYRKAAEAVTLHRMEIVESVKPHGYKEWLERAKKLNKEIKDRRDKASGKDVDQYTGEGKWVEKEALRSINEEIENLEEELSHEPPLESSQYVSRPKRRIFIYLVALSNFYADFFI